MFDINFHLFHDENFSDYLPADQQYPAPASPNETHHQRLRPGEGQSGVTHRGECVAARHQRGDSFEHLRFLFTYPICCRLR